MLNSHGLRHRLACSTVLVVSILSLPSCGRNPNEGGLAQSSSSLADYGKQTPNTSTGNGIVISMKKADASQSTDAANSTPRLPKIPDAAPPFDLGDLEQLILPASVESPTPLPEARPADTPPLVPVFLGLRLAQQFFSLHAQEGANVGFVPQGKAFSVYSYRLDGMVMLYRCYKGAIDTHFVTLGNECVEKFNGTVEGPYGYISVSHNPEERALFRCFNTNTGKYTTTLDAVANCEVGASTITTIGYVR